MALRVFAVAVLLIACLSPEPEGLAPAPSSATTVKMDLLHKPLPEIPLPNDIATRYDPTSATGRRINASLLAPTQLESTVRGLMDQLDGFSQAMAITIPFTGPLDVQSVIDAHRDPQYDFADDVVYLVDVTRSSPEFGELKALDLGNGSYPVILESRDGFGRNDPRSGNLTLLFEEIDEDTNGNGKLDPGEDTDADGVLDKPNFYPGATPSDDPAERAAAIMTFYEKETNTLIAKPVVPLRERTTYAVVVTRRLKDADGNPVGSPYPTVNHPAQTEALKPLEDVMPAGLSMDDIAFAFTFTTQTTTSEWLAVRDGLYGHGVQKHLGEDFPPEVTELLPMKDPNRFDDKRITVMRSEDFLGALDLINQIDGPSGDSVAAKQLMDFYRYVDFLAIGSFESPQLFPRGGEEVKDWLPTNLQSWPTDLDRVPAETRSETIYFYIAVPRKEVSARGQGKPAPAVIMGHGHGGNRFTVTDVAGQMAKFGMATVAIDCVGHGLEINADDRQLAETILTGLGYGPFFQSAFRDRSYDADFDGEQDSGADFWTFYVFHTRDVVRQSLLDYMQLVRVLRSFDGEKKWSFDVDGDGENELAGDFDGDGEVDVGGDAQLTMSGGSLGGIMSFLVGALEPRVTAIAPVVGGGIMSEITRRTFNGSVRKAVHLRLLGPLFAGTTNAEGRMELHQLAPRWDEAIEELHFATVDGISPGDTMLAENLVNGQRQCGQVDPNGLVRVGVESDAGDMLRISFYEGPVFRGGDDCEITTDADPIVVIDSIENPLAFMGQMWEPGEPLLAATDGLGMRRGTPDIRRFMSIAQIVLDRADPAIYAKHLLQEPVKYPGTGESAPTHALILTGTGDLNVPVSTGINAGRAAGVIPFRGDNLPGYDVPANQALIDMEVTMGVEDVGRFRHQNDDSVRWLVDADDFSGDSDRWGGAAPRAEKPLRVGLGVDDAAGGASAAFFPYGDPNGKHGFDGPGSMIDKGRDDCRNACGEDEDCKTACNDTQVWDVGNFFFNMMGTYLQTNGQEIRVDACQADNTCADYPPLPEPRTAPR